MPALTVDENASMIAELERVKDFAIGRESISRIVLKKPGSWGIGLGKIAVTQESGPEIRIVLRHPIAYDRLDQLIRAFAPELVSW